MQSIGIRELKEHTSQILRRVREKGQSLQVTYRGQVIALILPAPSTKPQAQDLETCWADLDQLTAEIGAHWPASAFENLWSDNDRLKYDSPIPFPVLNAMATVQPYSLAFGFRGNELICRQRAEEMPSDFTIISPLEILEKSGIERIFEIVD